MPTAQQTSGRLSMQRLGLNIYSWQLRKENAASAAFRAFSSATMPPTDATQAGEFGLGGEG